MTALLECVANVSEGRSTSTITAIARRIDAHPDVHVLDIHSDRDHHRSVYTFVGPPGPVVDASYAVAETAAARIDLRHHHGQHPRIGALDVVPFVPLRGATMEQAIGAANELGSRIADRLVIPVFFYGRAACHPSRTRLADIRRGGFEGLRTTLGQTPAQTPDLGPTALHPTAGAVAIGARDFLAAFNVVLDTSDVTVARRIAAAVRESGGGMPGVQAKGFMVGGWGQVSMNLTDLSRTLLADAFDRVAALADAGGVSVRESEIVGLVPSQAAERIDTTRLRLKTPLADSILERRLAAAGLR